MKMHTSPAARQRGFSILTGFILAIIMFGSLAFFLAGRGINTGFGETYTNTSKVSSLLASAGYIGTGFDAVKLNSQEPTFDSALLTGIFNPTSGGAALQPLDPKLFTRTDSTDGFWIYRPTTSATTGAILTGVGTALPEYTLMVSGLSINICKQINTMLNAVSILDTNPPKLTGITDALLFGAPTKTSSTTTLGVNLSAVGVQPVYTNGWTRGCFETDQATANYVYIQTLLSQ